MAGLLPLIAGTSTALYPVTRRITFDTNLAMAVNASEQRGKRRPALTELVLNYSRISAADLATMQSFVASQHGPYDSTWGMVLGSAALDGQINSGSGTLNCATSKPFTSAVTGQTFVVTGAGAAGGLLVATGTYVSASQVTLSATASTSVSGADTRWGIYLPALTLLDQQFRWMEEGPSRTTYSFTLRARQTQNPLMAWSGPGGTFPALGNGTATQFPYTQISRYQVLLNDNPTGMRYASNLFDGSASFPSAALHGWELSGVALQNSDLAIWEAFFRSQFGRFGTFTFVDPDSSMNYTKARFGTDTMEIVHQGFNLNAVKLTVVETN